MNHHSVLVVTNKCKEAGGSGRIPANMDLYAGGKTATEAGLARLSRNPDSEVDQMPFHRQSLDIANVNAFLSNFQRTVLRTLKFFAIDNPNQFFFAIFESLILKSANFLCTVKQSGRHFASLVFVIRGKSHKANVDLFSIYSDFQSLF